MLERLNYLAKKFESKGLTELEIVDNMSIRKARMLESADGCITLPGGPGTLEEASEAFSWAVIGDNSTPVTFLNVNHYYDSLINMFDEMTINGWQDHTADVNLVEDPFEFDGENVPVNWDGTP